MLIASKLPCWSKPVYLLVIIVSASWVVSSVCALPIFPSGSTEYRIELYSDGQAVWKIIYSIPLPTEDDRSQFQAYMGNFTASKDLLLSDFRERTISMVEEASELTGRPMEATLFNDTIDEIPTPTGFRGVVTYSFTWKGFLENDGFSLYMGDVFEGGLYLYENESLTVVPPSGYKLDQVTPAPDFSNAYIKWYGRKDFASGEPALLFSPRATALTLNFSTEVLYEGENAVLRGQIEPPFKAVITFLLHMPDGSTLNQTVVTGNDGHFTTTVAINQVGLVSAEALFAGDGEHFPSKSHQVTLTVNQKASPIMLMASLGVILCAGSASAVLLIRKRKRPMVMPSTELLDDKERLLAILRSHGGVMYQTEIKKQLGCSKSKTTALLNMLEQDGLVVKERRGRTNLINLKEMKR